MNEMLDQLWRMSSFIVLDQLLRRTVDVVVVTIFGLTMLGVWWLHRGR